MLGGSQAGIAPQGLSGRNHFEADIVVTCGSANDYRSINAEPLLIVEIQSPSTERDDHFFKLPQYQAIPSVEEILYIESERVAATIYRRDAAGPWQAIEIAGPQARLQSPTIGLDIPLSAVYRECRVWPRDCCRERGARLSAAANARHTHCTAPNFAALFCQYKISIRFGSARRRPPVVATVAGIFAVDFL